MLSLEESLKILKETNALIEGHFILSSGLHSSKYVQCAQLMSKPYKAKQICESLAEKIEKDFDWLGGVNFTSITSSRSNDSSYSSDNDFTSLALLDDVNQAVEIDTVTQEFRLASTGTGPLSWLVGGFYFDEQIEQVSGLKYGPQLRQYFDAILSGGATLNPAFAGPTPLQQVEGAVGFADGTLLNPNIRTIETFTQDNQAFSLFGSVDYELTDRLTFTVGGSYTEDEKNVTGMTDNNDSFSDLTLQGADGTRIIATNLFLNGDAGSGIPSFSGALMGLPFNETNLGLAASGAFGPAAAGYVAAVQAGAAAAAADPNGPLGAFVGLQTQPQFLSFGNSVEDGQTKDDKFTYTLKAAYEVSDNLNVYASTSTGFKSSSWNLTRDSRPFLADGPALEAAGLLPNNYIVATGRNFGTRFAEPEEATVYELGLKARFNWGAVNIAVFDQSIENFQATIFAGTGFVLSNAGETSTQGIEFDSTVRPVDGLTLGFAAIVQDPVYDDFTGAGVLTGGPIDLADGVADGVGDLTGQKPSGVNDLAFSVSGQYEFNLSDKVEAFVRADYQYEDEVRIGANLPASVTRDASFVNAAMGVSLENGLDIRFWGRNLFNHETFTSGFPGVVQAGTFSSYPNQPRTYGVSLRKNF